MSRVDERKAAMRAIQIARLDGPQAAEIVEIDEPSGDGEVLIDVHAAGVAFPDALQSRGLYQHKPEMPYTPGAEVAGVVRSAPDGAHVTAGDRVAGLTMLCGAMAEVVALQPDRVFNLPDRVSFEAGAGLLFNDLTMHHALRTRGRLAEGETVLVHGAAGGIGTSTLRLAPAWGASRTIAVVSTEDKIAIATAAGASDVRVPRVRSRRDPDPVERSGVRGGTAVGPGLLGSLLPGELRHVRNAAVRAGPELDV